MKFVDLQSQYQAYREDIDAAIQRVLDHGRFIMGPEVEEVEASLSQYVGMPYAVSCASGTDALLMALMALDVGPGDEVVTVPFTWISTAEVITLAGATVRFVDINPDTYLIDTSELEKVVNASTKAVIPVDLFGQMAAYEDIYRITEPRGIPVIQDAAQAFGARRHGQIAGSFGAVSCTSFFPAKPLGCYGDGGCCFTSDASLAKRLRAIRNHGCEERHQHYTLGLNGRFYTIQAAVILAI